jgi:hypothetical protein
LFPAGTVVANSPAGLNILPSVVPIYEALCASILQRREMLREGMSVYEISKMSLIDAHEVTAAHEKHRKALLRKRK